MNEENKKYFIGLGLGLALDYSALAIIEKQESRFECRHLKRWQLRTSYPQIVLDVESLVRKLNALQPGGEKPVLVIDSTGVGSPVVELFKPISAVIKAIQIVAGANPSTEDEITKVPKRDLVSTVQVCLQNRTLKIAENLRETAMLRQELENFTTKITTDPAADAYTAWREGQNDDLVLTIACALWQANQPVYEVEEQRTEQVFMWW